MIEVNIFKEKNRVQTLKIEKDLGKPDNIDKELVFAWGGYIP